MLVKLFINPEIGELIKNINTPTNPVETNGITNIGIIGLKPSGTFQFLTHLAIYPAANPATIPPRNPAPALLAKAPPTSPGASPGLSAILIAMYPDNTGIISPKAVAPKSIIAFKNGFVTSAPAPTFIPDNAIDKAIKTPPQTTSGSIFDTPFIKCLYNPVFSFLLKSLVTLLLEAW